MVKLERSRSGRPPLGEARRSRTITVSLTAPEFQRLREFAAEASLSSAARLLVLEALDARAEGDADQHQQPVVGA